MVIAAGGAGVKGDMSALLLRVRLPEAGSQVSSQEVSALCRLMAVHRVGHRRGRLYLPCEHGREQELVSLQSAVGKTAPAGVLVLELRNFAPGKRVLVNELAFPSRSTALSALELCS